MADKAPANALEVKRIVEERLAALASSKGAQEAVTVEWRGSQIHVPVISMPVNLLHYNPGTHRIRAQRSMDPARERELDSNPYGAAAQAYLHQLLMGDPADPTKVDPSFLGLKEDLSEYGQNDAGLISRSGVLINGNTRRAALKELGVANIRVGVLPTDAGHDDLESIELSLQLRRDHRRDYSFMNFLLAVDERVVLGEPALKIQGTFRIQASTYERARWILSFVRDAIKRSEVTTSGGQKTGLRLVDFEAHQGKLEELYRAYCSLAQKSPDKADALREQRLLALALNKSKTDLRLIEADFVQKYLPNLLQPVAAGAAVKIPGTTISVAGPSEDVQALRKLTTEVLRARALESFPSGGQQEVKAAAEQLQAVDAAIGKGLDLAGKQARLVKRKLAAADRISDACDDLAQAVAAVAEARAGGTFDPEDLDEILLTLKVNFDKLAAIIVRGSEGNAEGIKWLKAASRVAS